LQYGIFAFLHMTVPNIDRLISQFIKTLLSTVELCLSAVVDMNRDIFNLHEDCYSSFEAFAACLQRHTDISEGQPSGRPTTSAIRETREQLIKYRVWAGNVGAFQKEAQHRLSLDYRLRDAPFFREQVSVHSEE
jgi:hypothetical protein